MDHSKYFQPTGSMPNEMLEICSSYLKSNNWYIIVTSNDVLTELQVYVRENIPNLDLKNDIKSWEEPYMYGQRNPFGYLIIALKKEKVTKDQFESVIGDSVEEGKDSVCLCSPYRRDSEEKLLEFMQKLSVLT